MLMDGSRYLDSSMGTPGGVAHFILRLELAMGTPISEEPDWLAREYWLPGKPMEIEYFVRAGFDVALLEAKFKLFKPQIPYLPKLKSLKSYLKSTRVDMSLLDMSFLQAIDKEKLLDMQCLHLVGEEGHSLLSLHPTLGGSFPAFDLFITRKGEWILYLNENYGDRVFLSKVSTLQELVDKLEECKGDDKRYQFYPNYPLMVIAEQLDVILEVSINVRQERLRQQKRVLKKMRVYNERVDFSN